MALNGLIYTHCGGATSNGISVRTGSRKNESVDVALG